jgi:hypothetical protein
VLETSDRIDLPDVLFLKDWARLLHCHLRTVQCRRRQLPDPLPVSGRERWTRQMAEDWLAGRRRRR